MDRWTAIGDRVLAPVVARLGTDSRLLEFVTPQVDGIVDAGDLADVCRCAPPTAAALSALLADARYRHVVKGLVIAARSVPEPLLRPMLVAAARTLNPSCNQDFVFPCTLTFGRRRVVTTLLDIALTGSNSLKAGAVNALYWAWAPRQVLRWRPADPAPAPGPPDEPVEDLRQAFLTWAVREFIENTDVDVRRVLVPHVVSARDREPVLAERAVAIAKNHTDAYIRQRVASDLGESQLIPCLPNRTEG